MLSSIIVSIAIATVMTQAADPCAQPTIAPVLTTLAPYVYNTVAPAVATPTCTLAPTVAPAIVPPAPTIAPTIETPTPVCACQQPTIAVVAATPTGTATIAPELATPTVSPMSPMGYTGQTYAQQTVAPILSSATNVNPGFAFALSAALVIFSL